MAEHTSQITEKALMERLLLQAAGERCRTATGSSEEKNGGPFEAKNMGKSLSSSNCSNDDISIL
jgi:hypothetical protein